MPGRLGKDPEIYNIPAHQSFVDVLARGVLDRFGSDPLSLSKVLILLPNRRAVRSLREAFLRLSGGKATVLPDMQPIGDIDEDGLVIGGGGFYDDLALKPSVPPFMRQSILMEIIRSWYKRRGEDIPESANRAQLAEALANLLDQIQTEELSFDDLVNIVPEEYSIHWQQTLEFLKILTEHWPEILSSTGYMDSAERRNSLMKALRDTWLENPPQNPIIAAGSTGSIKATSSLLEVIARLPNGMVVLPGLDRNLDDDSWEAISEGHPQAVMKSLLDRMRADRVELKNWNGSDENADHSITILFREVMRPAATTHKWRELQWPAQEAIEGVTQIVAPGVREEAGIIAFKMREQLEYEGKTAALVTPDRMLARQVSTELKRWGIDVDDSAGTPLFNTPVGTYLRLIAELIGEKFAPVPLLACLKHPLTAGGISPGDFRSMVRQLEKRYLRGPRPSEGLDGIEKLLKKSSSADEQLQNWWASLKQDFLPFDQSVTNQKDTFGELLINHIKVAEKLASSDERDGAERVWKGDDGEAAAQLIEELMEASDQFGPVPGSEYPALFSQLMSGVTVRAKYGTHPRLNIWGPLEARLQHADLMILSGLNEGSWPPEYKADPWMSRPMRRDFGLPDLEQKTGLSAHDFVQAASAKNVVITRAEKQDGTPTVKSRWLSRLHAIIGDSHHKDPSEQWLNWYNALDKPDHEPKPIDPPCPRPPVAARPRELSVTRIQLWMQDPYSLYANKILKLTKLDDLDQDPTAIDKGVMIHRILEEFMASYKDVLPENAEEKLIEIGKRYFSDAIDKPTVAAFWWPRFKQIAKWFIEEERERRQYAKTVATESLGEITLEIPMGEFKLSATADRIDAFANGGYSVIDYKTGSPPSTRELKAGFAPQLPLEAAIAIHDGFHSIKSDQVKELSYWKLTGGEIAGTITDYSEEAYRTRKIDVPAEAQKAYEGLTKLVATFDLPETPYLSKPRPQSIGYGEYDHLARTKEWGEG